MKEPIAYTTGSNHLNTEAKQNEETKSELGDHEDNMFHDDEEEIDENSGQYSNLNIMEKYR